MIGGISRAGARLFEAQERLVFAGKHGLYVREQLVAKLCTVDLGAEPGQLVAAPAPALDETLACHDGTRMIVANAPPGGLSERATPSFHSVLSDLGGRSQPSPCCSAHEPAKLEEHMARGCKMTRRVSLNRGRAVPRAP